MKAIWRVFRYEVSRTVRRRGFQFVAFGVPILALLIFTAIQTIVEGNARNPQPQQPAPDVAPPIADDSPLRNIRPSGYVDLSGLLAGQTPEAPIPFADEAAAQAALREGRIGSYYVIAADYTQTGRVDLIFEQFNLGNINNRPIQVLLLQALLSKAATPVAPEVVARLQQREVTVRTNVVAPAGGQATETNENASFILVYVFGLLLAFTAFSTSSYLMQSVVEEKETRMVEVLLSSLRPRELLAGKFLALSLLGFVQMALWIAAALYILRGIVGLVPQMIGFQITGYQLGVMVIYFVLGYLMFGAAYTAIGAIASNMREGPQFAVFVTIPAAIPYYFITIFTTAPNGGLATALSIFPLTAPLSMVMRSAVVEVPIGELLVSMAVTAATIVFFVWLAARLFRVNTLLAGQTPKLRDLVRLVREAA
jgi:ABC-2 type transport system permease protein